VIATCYRERALTFQILGKTEDALKDCEKALIARPGERMVLLQKAAILFDQGNFIKTEGNYSPLAS